MHRTLNVLFAVFGVASASIQAFENTVGHLDKRSARKSVLETDHLTTEHTVLTRSEGGYAPTLEIQNPVLTSKWFEDSDFVQVLELGIYNSHSTNYLTLADTLNVTLTSDSLELVQAATLTRLAPSQAAIVQIGVKNKPGVTRGSQCSGSVVATYGQAYGAKSTTKAFTGTCGIPDYQANENSIDFHWSPEWYNNAKFGIFIHWGIYSVPAYGSVQPNEDYAEWYGCRMHDPNYRTKTYQYHEATYGKNFNYDQFMSNFSDAGYDPKEWVDLFAAAGARYMVPVTKHHEGFALFDTSDKISKRSSMHYGPKRDLTGALLDAAAQYQPHIRRGTYFSMPEWFNPAYYQYRNSDSTWGGGCFGANDTNPYTGATVEYTGYVPVDDFVKDIQLPQMKELAYNYNTEIMWCDIGGPNNSTIFVSEWLNWARTQGRQITFNSRCGLNGDFSTPEYRTNGDTVVAKWETNRGMDPFSFGYNYQTPDDQYLNGNDIVQTLVDTVSKNGNFLLDIGPTHNGSIPQIMQNGLKDAGSWIIPHGEAIYDTRFWSPTPGTGNLRYTTTKDAFYIFCLTKPSSTLTISDPVPWLPGDTITALGGTANGTVIPTQRTSSGLVLQIPDEAINGDKYVWCFKLSYTSTW
ncbi:alpha-L-fucosidase [Fusarium subglutinans]|uniref:alpha-L-fucosidase n=1 Tax=Gibberella subglutinans TaxID=42677 RepID=A0A8H5V249_GIBSU|nr:alpha-L-fucosidase [Fusarium subglutinans]KAF5605990.1 alpha-L-fucosidase [Fusarium subglutinans]